MASLENYTIIKNLGSGAFGQVKRKFHSVARHNLTNTQVAIKVIKKKLAQEQGVLKNIKLEAQFLRKFSHPNIIKLYQLPRFEHIITETVQYLILEYVPGGELYLLLEKRGKLTESEAKRTFYQILSAVEYCHTHGVAHRDIKPENILLDEFKNIKLGDFGLSNCMKDGEFMKTPCGSANYAAPEIVSGQKYAGTEVDVWSLGVLLYTLLAGSLPFDEASMPLLISKIKEAKFRIPYHFSPLATDLIEKMIVANPLMRISISEIFHHPWISETYPLPPICNVAEPKIDDDIFKQLLKMPQFSSIDAEEKKLKILESESYDLFTVSYEMLNYSKIKSEGMKKNCTKRVFKQIKSNQSECSFAQSRVPNDWRFCVKFEGPQERVMIRLCEVLKKMECRWKFLTPFYIKIIHKGKTRASYIKVEARLYEVREIQDRKEFFIDFRLLLGLTFAFLDWSSALFRLCN